MQPRLRSCLIALTIAPAVFAFDAGARAAAPTGAPTSTPPHSTGSSTPPSAPPPVPTVLSHWAFDGNFKDSSPYGKHLSPGNTSPQMANRVDPTWVADKEGHANSALGFRKDTSPFEYWNGGGMLRPQGFYLRSGSWGVRIAWRSEAFQWNHQNTDRFSNVLFSFGDGKVGASISFYPETFGNCTTVMVSASGPKGSISFNPPNPAGYRDGSPFCFTQRIWHDTILSYNGSELFLYDNGVLVSSSKLDMGGGNAQVDHGKDTLQIGPLYNGTIADVVFYGGHITPATFEPLKAAIHPGAANVQAR